MPMPKRLADFRSSTLSPVVAVALDSLYGRGDASPVARAKPAARQYADLVALLGDALHNKLRAPGAGGARDVPFTTLFAVAEMALFSSAQTLDIFLEVMDPVYKGDFLTCHSLNVAFLSCKVGRNFDLSYQELTRLGVAALLHDIGMLQVDAACCCHDRELSREERAAMEEHPTLGWRFFEPLQQELPWLARVILEEHRRENGQGYPAGIQGDLHLYSKIVGLCDCFEALSHERPYRKAFHPGDAIKSLVEAKQTLFRKDLLKSLIESLSLYPVGSLVQLNNNRAAQVIEAVAGAPMRPRVRVLSQDRGGLSQTQEDIDLSRENNLYITGLVYSEHVQLPKSLKSGK